MPDSLTHTPSLASTQQCLSPLSDIDWKFVTVDQLWVIAGCKNLKYTTDRQDMGQTDEPMATDGNKLY